MAISESDFETIAALDLDPIKVKLMHRESGEGWTLHQANAIESEYRRFLYLMKKFPNELAAPRFDVDIFWHYHILDTVKYAQDCQSIFGYFLHHFPYLGLRGEEDLEIHHQVGERMRELYEETFDEPYVRGNELWTATETGFSEEAGGIRLASATAATAYSVRAPVAADTAYSVRSPASIAGAQTAYSVRAPVATDTAYSVRPPASIAGAQTAYSVRARLATETAYSVRAAGLPADALADRRQAGESPGYELEHSLATFYSRRPRLEMVGVPQ